MDINLYKFAQLDSEDKFAKYVKYINYLQRKGAISHDENYYLYNLGEALMHGNDDEEFIEEMYHLEYD